MICPSCGAPVDNDAKICEYCGAQIIVEKPAEASFKNTEPSSKKEEPKTQKLRTEERIIHKCPKDYQVLAFISLFLFLPFGIPALVNSNNVYKRFSTGDYAGAEDCSIKARKWATSSICLSIILAIIISGAGF